MVQKRWLGPAGWYGVAVAMLVAGVVILQIVLPKGPAFQPALSLGAVLLLAAASMPFVAMAWARTDEAAREAHKFAWFWGGSFATLAVFLVLTAAAFFEIRHLIDLGQWGPGRHPGPLYWMTIGAAVMSLGQGVGYVLVWAGWWIRRR